MTKEVFIDTNILIYLVDHGDPRHRKAQVVIKDIFDRRLTGVVSAQIFLEFAAIASDRCRIPEPLSTEEIYESISTFRRIFRIIVPTEIALNYWMKMVKQHEITRQKVFDTFLVATAYENNISTIYTENINDFRIYPNIEIVNPLIE